MQLILPDVAPLLIGEGDAARRPNAAVSVVSRDREQANIVPIHVADRIAVLVAATSGASGSLAAPVEVPQPRRR